MMSRVGSLITQGVYSVATPFHPFGGAVDIIVVQQQDGSFRSTPWYVQFGKFQGVLKGAEKMVRITVNGVEADFHMYLNNSGEAYFVREGDLGHDDGDEKGGLKDESKEVNDQSNVDNFRLKSDLSDSGILGDNFRLERNESDASLFYDFQDDQSFDSPIELLSEYGSGRFDNSDMEKLMEAQGTDSEMLLVSVDGHILTAPILSSEQLSEYVQLDTPQFHLGPGEGNMFSGGDNSFTVVENAWDSKYLNDIDTPSSQSLSIDTCKLEDNVIPDQVKEICEDKGTDVLHNSEVCEKGKGFGKTEDVGEVIVDLQQLKSVGCKEEPLVEDKGQESYSVEIVPKDIYVSSDVEGTSVVKGGEDRFKSCLDFTKHASGETFESEDSPSKAQEVKYLEEKPPLNVHESNINETKYATEPQLDDDSCSFAPDVSSQVVERVHTDIESPGSASTSKDEDLTQNPSAKAPTSSLEEDVAVTETHGGDVLEGQTTNSSEQKTANLRPIEISLCGHLLRPGMGSNAAAETFKTHLVSEEEFRSSAMSIIKNGKLVIRYRGKFLPWEKAAPIVLGLASFGLNMPLDSKDAIPVEEVVTPKLGKSNSEVASGRRWRLWSIPFRRVPTLHHSNSASSDEVFVDSESFAQSPSSIPQSPTSLSDASGMETCKSPLKKIFRTNITTNEQIASLNLKEGQNDVTFSFSTRVLGLQQVEAHIYLWKWNARIVISDVDGTITKSDVLGQFMPLVGKDWSQSGVARLFSAIKENGYQLLFLSARAIVQAYLTKSFLFNLKQDGKTLPTGPVVISPDGLFPSLFREVIRRAPHEFKIACLEDIKALFPSDYNPFYAGFGNRDTDEYTYKKLGIPKGKIFIINPKGEVAINHRIDVKSYTSLHTLVHDMFPPTSMVEQEDYNPWNYWKLPIPDIDD